VNKAFFRTREFISFAPLLLYLFVFSSPPTLFGLVFDFDHYRGAPIAVLLIYCAYIIGLFKASDLYSVNIHQRIKENHLPFFYSTIITVVTILNRQFFLDKRDHDEYYLLVKIALIWCVGLLIWFLNQENKFAPTSNGIKK